MTLLEQWQNMAYDTSKDQKTMQEFWQRYFLLEKGIYEKLLENPDEEVKGTVKELAEKYEIELMPMVGFLDGINESQVTPNPIDTMEEDTEVSLAFDKENCTATWWRRRRTGFTIFPSGKRSLTRRQEKNSTRISGTLTP